MAIAPTLLGDRRVSLVVSRAVKSVLVVVVVVNKVDELNGTGKSSIDKVWGEFVRISGGLLIWEYSGISIGWLIVPPPRLKIRQIMSSRPIPYFPLFNPLQTARELPSTLCLIPPSLAQTLSVRLYNDDYYP